MSKSTRTTLGSVRLAGITHEGAYCKIGDTFSKLGQVKFRPSDSKRRQFAVYTQDPSVTPESELRSFAGIELFPNELVPAGTSELLIEAGSYAQLIHIGPYSTLPASWDQVFEDLHKEQWQPRYGQALEEYVIGCDEVGPEGLQTNIYVPIEP